MYKQNTRDYIRKINISRPIDGEFHLLVKRSSRNGPGIIFQVFSNEFTAIWSITILFLIKSKIDHNYTRQIPISAAERLAIIKTYNNFANISNMRFSANSSYSTGAGYS